MKCQRLDQYRKGMAGVLCVILYIFTAPIKVNAAEAAAPVLPWDNSVLPIVDTQVQLYSYEEMVEDLTLLKAQYGELIHLNVIGMSWDGRTIYEAVLGKPQASRHIMVQASMHGREYITAQVAMKQLEYYAAYWNIGMYGGQTYAQILADTAIHVIPMSNPDGVTISQFGEAGIRNEYYRLLMRECYQRDKASLSWQGRWVDIWKNGGKKRGRDITYEEYLNNWKANAAGVDLNRNFDAFWVESDSKAAPSFANFKGYAAYSEPETWAVCSVADTYPISCFLNYHAMGEVIYYDVSYTTQKEQSPAAFLAAILSAETGYRAIPTRDLENRENGGGFGDWVPLIKGMPNATIEMGKSACPVPVSEFPVIFEQNRENWAMIGALLYGK